MTDQTMRGIPTTGSTETPSLLTGPGVRQKRCVVPGSRQPRP